MHFDVFNGDADGLCALLQLRLTEEREATLVTGVKRDIRLLDRVDAAADDALTVLDVSLDSNRAGLARALAAGAEVTWFDHHYAGEIPAHPRLHACIDTAPQVCTSLLVDRRLGGAQRAWAVTAAFGDNMAATACRLAGNDFSMAQTEQLRALGEALNYNAYGESEADLRLRPAALYAILKAHRSPFAFIADSPTYAELRKGYREDMEFAEDVRPVLAEDRGAVYVLPDTAWARRVSGAFANRLTTAHPQQAAAVLTSGTGGGFTVSVRAPLARPSGADALCRQFESGGGRKSAAGINRLPAEDFERFLAAFRAAEWGA